MPSIITRAVGFICLVTALVSCCSPKLPCISGQMRPRPIYVDHEGFCALEREIDCLNHRFAPYEPAMDHLHFPRRICQRLVQVDNALLHVNAELISREVAPEEVQRQVNRIKADLSWIEALTCVPRYPNKCCKSHGEMAASLDGQLASQRGKKAPTSPSLFRINRRSR